MMMGSINSPSECVKYCISKGYSYAGLQAAKWCHCGNSFGRHGKVQDSECSMKCPGDNKWTCGNHFRNEVYSSESAQVASCHQITRPMYIGMTVDVHMIKKSIKPA
uniref:WSC domain-containing protein n=1 Tax=Macrostomum lignano TaxID=282301 RepID=A0A1I8J2J5_9PLAT